MRHLTAAMPIILSIALASASVDAQQSIVNTTKSNTKDRSTVIAPDAAKGWDGKIHGNYLRTQVVIGFDDPADYDTFAAGRLPITVILRNLASGRTITLDPHLVSQDFQRSADKTKIALHVVIDNLDAPIWDGKGCTDTSTSADHAPGGGVIVTLSYVACGSAFAGAEARPAADTPVKHSTGTQRAVGQPIGGIIVKGGQNPASQRTAGAPIGGIIVKGGKNPGGNLRIATGTVTLGELGSLQNVASAPNTIVLHASRGAGSTIPARF